MENLNNLPPFYVGQKIVYITGHNMPKDSIHIVKGIKISCCEGYAVNVGIKTKRYFEHKNNGITHIRCSKCKRISEIDDFFNWILASSFRPLQESPFPSLTMKEVVKEESKLVSLN